MWETTAINNVRIIIGDADPANHEYSDERITDLFLVAANLVLLDATFSEYYAINISEKTITPDPSKDIDFMALVSLRASCVLLDSEMRSKATRKVAVSDGLSEVSMDNSGLLASLKETSKRLCEKYEQAVFSYTAGESIGVAILGPYSPGSHIIGNHHSNRNSY